MIELYFIDQCPARLCRALARIPGTVRAYGRPAPELQKLFLRGHGEIRRSQARPKLILPKTMYTYRSTRIGPGMKQTILQPGER